MGRWFRTKAGSRARAPMEHARGLIACGILLQWTKRKRPQPFRECIAGRVARFAQTAIIGGGSDVRSGPCTALNESGPSKRRGVPDNADGGGARPAAPLNFRLLSRSCFSRSCGKSGVCDSLPAERTKNDLLSLTRDGGEVFGAFEAFRVKFVDILRLGRAGAEPTTHRDDLQTANRCIVAWRASKLRRDRFAGQFGGSDGFR